jgi:hypothetical protein
MVDGIASGRTRLNRLKAEGAVHTWFPTPRYTRIEMTAGERQSLTRHWGYKPCPHSGFENVEGMEGVRACVSCGQFLDDIINESSHREILAGMSLEEPTPKFPARRTQK